MKIIIQPDENFINVGGCAIDGCGFDGCGINI